MSTAAAVPETWELSGDDAWETLRTTGRARLASDAFRRFRAADGTSHARSMAFVSMLIVIQGVIIVLGLASAIGQGNLTDLIVKTLQSAAPGPAGKLMTQAVDQAHQAGASNRSTALILGLVAVLISGTILMGQLERGLNRIYGIEQDRPTAIKYLHAFVLTITAGLLITAAFVTLGVGRSVAASLGSHSSVQIWNVIRWPVGLALAMVAIALLYRWAPRRRQPAWSWLGFGSFVAVAPPAGLVLARLRIVRGGGRLDALDDRVEPVLPVQLLVRSDVRTAGGNHRARALGVPGVRGSPLWRCDRSAVGGGTRRRARASRGRRQSSPRRRDRCRLAAATSRVWPSQRGERSIQRHGGGGTIWPGARRKRRGRRTRRSAA